MKKNYVLIDYENVQPEAMEALEREHFHVIVFVGANQAKVTYEVASVLQRMGERAAYIKIAANGSNALDFHIAYYIGQLSAREPAACFHIVSKDSGFDPLVEHLKSKKIAVRRVKAITDFSIVKGEIPQSLSDRVSFIEDHLGRCKAARPKTLKTLSSFIDTRFQKTLAEVDIADITARLISKGVIVVDESKVSYG